MSQKLLSVIIPVYKVEKYLRRCLDSVRNQTYRNIEVILVDDGSPDECPKICDEYAAMDERFHVIHKINGGVSSARNAGLDVCVGEYIFFVDSDDYLALDIVEKCVSAIGNNDIDAVVFGSRHQFIDGDKVIDCQKKIPDVKVYNCGNFNEILYGPIRNMYGIPGSALSSENQRTVIQKYKQFVEVWCWCFSRQTCFEHGISFHDDLVCGEDEIFICEFLTHAEKIMAVPDIGYEYLVRADGAVKTRAYAPNIIDNKVLLAKYRESIRKYIYDRSNIDIGEWGYGSAVLSIFQLCVALSKEKHGYKKLKEYISLGEVQNAIKNVPLKGRPKFVLPFFLVKIKCYRLLYTLLCLLQKIGIPVRL